MQSATITLTSRRPCPRAPHEGCWGNTAFGTLKFGPLSAPVTASGNRKYNLDVVVGAKDCYPNKRSNEFGVDMPYAVGPVEWRTGVYVHQYPMMCSAGCVHLNPTDAKAFFDWVRANGPVRIVVKSQF